MPNAIEVFNLGRNYGKKVALQNCTFELPEGRIAGLVGPNGAGKTTLMNILVGLLPPSSGQARVFGYSVKDDMNKILPEVGYLAQDHPLHRSFTVEEMLHFGRVMNQRWDDAFVRSRLEALNIPMDQRSGSLSGGQQAQLALGLALSKQPRLLVLDEPFASLDPLARQEFMQILMAAAADNGHTILISSHQLADLSRICDSLILLDQARCLLAGDLEYLLEVHQWISVPAETASRLQEEYSVLKSIQTDRYMRLLVRTDQTFGPSPIEGAKEPVTLEEMVLAYMESSRKTWMPSGVEQIFNGVTL